MKQIALIFLFIIPSLVSASVLGESVKKKICPPSLSAWNSLWSKQEKTSQASVAAWTKKQIESMEASQSEDYLFVVWKNPTVLKNRFPIVVNYEVCSKKHNSFLNSGKKQDLQEWTDCMDYYYHETAPLLYTWLSACYSKIAK